jgi:hypothetical protein
MESHGGYLCQFQDVDAAWLHKVAQDALIEDGQEIDDVGLLVTILGGPRIVRFAWDAPFTYGRVGAKWYLTHHALARRLSEHFEVVVHAYAFDADEVEQVVSYAGGRRVGGDVLRYEDAEVPDDESDDEDHFLRLQERWPLGHLARVLGVQRRDLLRAPRQATALIDLAVSPPAQPLWSLFPEAIQVLRHHELYGVS